MSALSVAHLRQEDEYGCALACVAMVLGLTYAQARSRFGYTGGQSYQWWQERLAQAGWAYQFHYRKVQPGNRDREPWPPAPWAPLHFCGVNDGRHACIMLADGTVLDPEASTPRTLTDYPNVGYVAGLHWIGSQVGGGTGLAPSDPTERPDLARDDLKSDPAIERAEAGR